MSSRKRQRTAAGSVPSEAAPELSPAVPVQVHRCRFVNWTPSAIVALAFNDSGSRLAVARESGDIEVWNTQFWHCELVLPGAGEAVIRSLFWLEPERLFSVGLNGRIVEWDLLRLVPKFSSDSYGGAVWCASLAPVEAEKKRQKKKGDEDAEEEGAAAAGDQKRLVVLGCEDGSLRIFDLSDATQAPAYVRSIFKHDGRVLSVCWGTGNLIASGGSDGTIRLWSTTSWRNMNRITVEGLPKQKTLVWAIKLLSDGTVVSGDSLGHIQFWDGRHGTLLQTFSHHKADVLALAVEPGEQAIYATGVDSAVGEIRRVSDSSKGGAGAGAADGRWVLTAAQRAHTHDVHALAIGPMVPTVLPGRRQKGGAGAEAEAPVMTQEAWLASGGTDTQLGLYKAGGAQRAFRHRPSKRAPFPHRPSITVAPANGKKARPARFLLHQGKSVQLWQLGSVDPATEEKLKNGSLAVVDGDTLALSEGCLHLASIDLTPAPTAATPQLNLTCSALSPDSRWVACSDSLAVKLFKIDIEEGKGEGEEGAQPRVRITKVAAASKLLKPAYSLAFAPDSSRLIVGTLESTVQVLNLKKMEVVGTLRKHGSTRPAWMDDSEDEAEDEEEEEEEDDKKSKKRRKAKKPIAVEKRDKRPGLIRAIAVSADGQWLCSGDHLNRIHVFNFETLEHHATLPVFDAPFTALAFHPLSATLVVTCADNRFYLYDVEDKRLSDWTRDNAASFPSWLLSRPDHINRIAFDPSRPTTLLLCSSSYMCHVDLKQPVAEAPEDAKAAAGKKRRRSEAEGSRQHKGKGFLLDILEREDKDKAAPRKQSHFRLLEQFRPLLAADYVSEGALLVVETPWLKIVQRFPEPLSRPRYGT